MKFFKDISFWCIILTIVVIMVVHHILSKRGELENFNEIIKKAKETGDYTEYYNLLEKLLKKLFHITYFI